MYHLFNIPINNVSFPISEIDALTNWYIDKLTWKLRPDISYDIFQAIKLKLIDHVELLPKKPCRKAFIMVPYHIIFRQFDKVCAFIFAKWHFGMGELYEKFFLLVRMLFQNYAGQLNTTSFSISG